MDAAAQKTKRERERVPRKTHLNRSKLDNSVLSNKVSIKSFGFIQTFNIVSNSSFINVNCLI